MVALQMYHNFGGFRDGLNRQNKPTAPHKITGRKNRQLRSLFISTSAHEAVAIPSPDDPLSTTRKCEKNTPTTMSARAEMQASINPRRRRVEVFINAMPRNCYSAFPGNYIETGVSGYPEVLNHS
jgi:hypothetical protein